MVNFICNFEVYGKVQGVFFRKHTHKTAKSLGLKGWCMNTEYNTVKGQLQGPEDKIKQMQNWLSKVGSPKSKVEKAEFGDFEPISTPQFNDFVIRK